MNPNTDVIVPEVLPAESETKLVKYASQTGLEKQSTETLVEAFRPIFAKSRAAIESARGVAESVKDATCVKEIKKSRACRLALRSVRLESDGVRKKQKEHALLYGRAVDGFHNILLADLSPVETALQEAEDIAERAEAKRLSELKAAREAELLPLLDEPLLGNLADLSEADYMKKLTNAKLLRQAKLDAAAKVEADRLAKEVAERAERERLAAENAKLQAEAVALEAKAKAEREAAEKKLAEERAESARVAAELKAKADLEIARQAEIARKERAELEAKAKAEAARFAKIAAEERAAAEAKAKAAEAEAAKVRAELAAKAKAEDDRKAAEVAAVAKAAKEAIRAAAASDSVKLKRFADELRSLPKPALKDSAVQSNLEDLVEDFSARIEKLTGGELL